MTLENVTHIKGDRDQTSSEQSWDCLSRAHSKQERLGVVGRLGRRRGPGTERVSKSWAWAAVVKLGTVVP